MKEVDHEDFKQVIISFLHNEKKDYAGRQRKILEYLTPYESYQEFRCFLSEDERAGFAINKEELISMFSVSEEYDSDYLIQKAIELGAKTLDCFDEDGFLPSIYKRNGFEEFDRVQWDDAYAPKYWTGDRPDVVFMRLKEKF